MEKYSLNEKFNIKTEVTSSLVALIHNWKATTCPGWMMDMYVDRSAVPSKCTVAEAWVELVARSKESKESAVKAAIEVVSKDRMILVKPDASVTIQLKSGKEMPLIDVAGYHIKKNPEGSEAARTSELLCGIEVLSDVVNMQYKKSDDAKGVVEVVSREACVKVGMPFLPIGGSFYNNEKKRSGTRNEVLKDIDSDMRKKGVTVMAEKICSSLGVTWKGLSVECTLKRPAKVTNWVLAYRYLVMSREARGKDSGQQSKSSVGYYFGYMPESMYRTAYTVGDMIRLSQLYGTKRLEIPKVGGVFTQSVINSLLSVGWSIRIPFDYSRPIATEPNQNGLFKIVTFNGVYLSYDSLINDKFPLNGKIYHETEAMETFVSNYIKEPSNCVHFGYVYANSKTFKYSSHLQATLHAHSGMVMCVSKPVAAKVEGEPSLIVDSQPKYIHLDEQEYLMRFVNANFMKNSFVYTREKYYPQDPYRLKVPIAFVATKVYALQDEMEFEFENYKAAENSYQIDPELEKRLLEQFMQHEIKAAIDKTKMEKQVDALPPEEEQKVKDKVVTDMVQQAESTALTQAKEVQSSEYTAAMSMSPDAFGADDEEFL